MGAERQPAPSTHSLQDPSKGRKTSNGAEVTYEGSGVTSPAATTKYERTGLAVQVLVQLGNVKEAAACCATHLQLDVDPSYLSCI
jgi:hypothetical protein